ncbi:MAG: alpha/beta fold hydrolase [Planctomycetota bacterium]
MSKISTSWHSDRLGKDVSVARWGEVGRPVLIFPTAAADAEEIERFHLVSALSEYLEAGRIKVYSVDSVAGQAWLKESNDARTAAQVQNVFDEFLVEELLPAIRSDCGGELQDIIVTGSSIGAFNALALLCRHPEHVAAAICMSGTYDLTKFLKGDKTRDWYESSPLDFLEHLPEDEHLEKLRSRFCLLTHGTGKWEEPEQSWRAAKELGARGIPNRVDEWGDEWDHDWPTWRNMLPQYLGEVLDLVESKEPAAKEASPKDADSAKPRVIEPRPARAKPSPAKSTAPKASSATKSSAAKATSSSSSAGGKSPRKATSPPPGKSYPAKAGGSKPKKRRK